MALVHESGSASRLSQVAGFLASGGGGGGQGDHRSAAGGPLGGVAGLGLSSSQISPQVSEVEEEKPVVTFAQGGRYVKVRIPGQPVKGGGRRQAITRFSEASARAMRALVNSIDQSKVPAACFTLTTLTYPREFPTARATKEHLDTLIKRHERAFGPMPIIWKLEPQKRGAPHYHLLTVYPKAPDVLAMRQWFAENWYQVVDSGDVRHLFAGTQFDQVATWAGVASYASKLYLTKTPNFTPEWHHPGRWWGVRRRELLPISLHVQQLPETQALQLRRQLVRYYEHQPTGRYKLTWPSGRVRRAWLSPQALKLLRAEDPDCQVRAYRRKWRSSRGGCSCYMADRDVRRLCVLLGIPGVG